MPVWLIYVLIALTIHRVTRLVIADTFPPLGVPRDHLMKFWDSHWGATGQTLRYLFSCPWCMSVWVGAGVIYAFTFFVSVPLPLAALAVSSTVTGLLANLEDRLSD